MQESPREQQGHLVLIDESLADRPLAQILRLVGYNAIAATEQFGQGAQDPTLIQWLGLQTGIWITMDVAAKRQHADVIRAAGIHIVWVRPRPKQKGLSTKDQAKLLLWVLDDVLAEVERARSPRQFQASYNVVRPKLDRL